MFLHPIGVPRTIVNVWPACLVWVQGDQLCVSAVSTHVVPTVVRDFPTHCRAQQPLRCYEAVRVWAKCCILLSSCLLWELRALPFGLGRSASIPTAAACRTATRDGAAGAGHWQRPCGRLQADSELVRLVASTDPFPEHRTAPPPTRA